MNNTGLSPMTGMWVSDDIEDTPPAPSGITDTFNGTAGTLAGRTTDTGGEVWTNNLGTANINGSGAAVNSSVLSRAYSTVDSGLTTYTLTCNIIGDGGIAFVGCLFRFQDINNFRAVCLSGLDMYVIFLDAGVETSTYIATVASTTNVITVEVTPTAFDVKVNGGASLYTGGSGLGSFAKQGLFLGASTANLITYFEVI